MVVAQGVLDGTWQTSDRAELCAIVVALEFTLVSQGESTLWSGNAYVAEGVAGLLRLRNIDDRP